MHTSETLLLKIDTHAYPLNQLKFEIPSVDLISWLSQSPFYPKVFWKEKETNLKRAAVGNLLSFTHLPDLSLSSDCDIRLYGGMHFTLNPHGDETWNHFPKECFWLPQIELTQENGKTECLIQTTGETMPDLSIWMLGFDNAILNPVFPRLLERLESPSFSDWEKRVATALKEIDSGHLQKLVLARKSKLSFDAPLSPWSILSRFDENSQETTLFAFQLSPQLCFLGSSPERFFQRRGSHLNTDAMASTRARGTTLIEDQLLEQELRNSTKENREFQFVSEFLEACLNPLSQESSWKWPEAQILKASHVQHLYNRFSTILKPNVSDVEIIQALHPTPALGGVPKDKALKLLSQLEPFDRGWYGAPLGILSPQETSLYVGIRSALISGSVLHLFAGTGLVKESTAEREWEELEQKIRPFTELFI